MIDIWIRTITLLESVLYLLYSNATYEYHGYTIKQTKLTYPRFLSYKDSYKTLYNPWLDFDKSLFVTMKMVLKLLIGCHSTSKCSRVNHNQNSHSLFTIIL